MLSRPSCARSVSMAGGMNGGMGASKPNGGGIPGSVGMNSSNTVNSNGSLMDGYGMPLASMLQAAKQLQVQWL